MKTRNLLNCLLMSAFLIFAGACQNSSSPVDELSAEDIYGNWVFNITEEVPDKANCYSTIKMYVEICDHATRNGQFLLFKNIDNDLCKFEGIYDNFSSYGCNFFSNMTLIAPLPTGIKLEGKIISNDEFTCTITTTSNDGVCLYVEKAFITARRYY